MRTQTFIGQREWDELRANHEDVTSLLSSIQSSVDKPLSGFEQNLSQQNWSCLSGPQKGLIAAVYWAWKDLRQKGSIEYLSASGYISTEPREALAVIDHAKHELMINGPFNHGFVSVLLEALDGTAVADYRPVWAGGQS